MMALVKNCRVFKIPLSCMSYHLNAHLISTGTKANHTNKGLGKDVVFCHTLRFNVILHEHSTQEPNQMKIRLIFVLPSHFFHNVIFILF